MPVKLLVVEDDTMLRKTLSDILPMYGDFEITLARDGLDAIEQVAAGLAPDVVLTDLKMPRMDGRALLDALRARGYAGPIALMTGLVMGADTSGFSAVFHKPFSVADMAREIAALARQTA